MKCDETKKGIHLNYPKSIAVSENGDFVWGNHIIKDRKCKLLRQCFSTGELFLYDYLHEDLIMSVLVVEDLQTVISGGEDKKAVLYDLDSGKIKQIFDLQYGFLTCLFRVGNVVALGHERRVRFFDLVNRKYMGVPHVQLAGNAYYMLTRKGKSKGNNVELLVGNGSPELKQITIKFY
jgi:WD40 repeat protein